MKVVKRLFRNRTVRICIVIVVTLLTFCLFGYYLWTHPAIIHTLTTLPPHLFVLLTIGYILVLAANAFVLHESLRLLKKRADFRDNVALTGYSSIVNFFGPLQSGPGFRAIYLKTKYNVRIRDFFGTSILFYGFFALISCVVLGISAVVQIKTWWMTLLVSGLAVAVLLGCWMLQRKVPRFHAALTKLKMTNRHTWLIAFGALWLCIATAFIYYVELIQVDSHITLVQAIVYSAAANLSLFVSLTPGAIGFREAFLVLSQKLHGIDTSSIVAANIIDRAFYVVFLLVLFVVLLALARRFKLSFIRSKQSTQSIGDPRHR